MIGILIYFAVAAVEPRESLRLMLRDAKQKKRRTNEFSRKIKGGSISSLLSAFHSVIIGDILGHFSIKRMT